VRISPASCHNRSCRREQPKTQSFRVKRRRLFLSAGDGVLDGLGSVAERLLGLAEDALALVLGAVAAAAGSISDLLGGRLVALCVAVSKSYEV
jgi:hypothetical protein